MAMNRTRISTLALLAGNVVPLLGVLLLGWRVEDVLVLYWIENLVVGVYAIARMLMVSPVGGFFSGAFFAVHYGGFCAGHGLFLLSLLKLSGTDWFPDMSWPGPLVFVELLWRVVVKVTEIAPAGWVWATVALLASHGVSLVINFWRGGEYRHKSINKIMMAPYPRMVALHVAIIAGGFAVMAMDSPLPMLGALVLLKVAIDVYLHRREHRDAATTADAPLPT
jgi:hypothetical protein